jgi:hypothetical protein
MPGRNSIQQLLALRKVTRAISDTLRGQVIEYLATLTPLLRPKAVLGDYVSGAHKEPARKADKAFKELQALYETVASSKPFNLPRELKPPIDLNVVSLEITPLDYAHQAGTEGERKTVIVRSPLTWVLGYTGYTPARLTELLAARSRSVEEVQEFVLAYLVVHIVTANQPGVAQILDALHFPLSTSKSPEFGELPITRISSAISTSRASDDLIIQSADLSGMDAFEEVVNVDDISRLRDPLKDRLLEIVRSQAPELASA